MRYLQFIFILSIAIYNSACQGSAKREELSKNDTIKKFDSINLFNAAIASEPDNMANYVKRAKYHLRNKEFDLAIKDVDLCLAKDSTNPDLLLLKVDACFFGNKQSEANALLTKSLIYNSQHIGTLLKNAEYKFLLNRYNEALTNINNAIVLDPNNAKSYFIKGMILKEKGDTIAAISSFITATEQNPEYYDAYMQLGTIQSFRNAPAAGKYFQNALKVNVNSDEAWVAFGAFLQKNNPNLKLAKDAYTNAIKANPENENAYYNLGAVYYMEKNYIEAIKNFSVAIDSDKDTSLVNSFYARGVCYKYLKYAKEAKQDFNTYLRLVPNDKEALEGLKGL